MKIVYQDLNELHSAEPLLQRTLQGYTDILGELHPDTLTAKYSMADFYETKGDLAMAESFSRQSLEGFASTGFDEEIGDGVEQLCSFLEQQGKGEEAEAIELKYQ